MLKQMQYDKEKNLWRGNLFGDLDAVDAPKLISAIHDALETYAGSIIFDCKQLDFVDSMGLGALVKMRKMAEEKGCGIRLLHMKPRIYKLFVITGLENTFGIEVDQ